MIAWRLGLAMVTLAVLGALGGAAASITLSGGSIGGATVATPGCATGAISVTPVLTSGLVSSVVVGSLPSACGGATIRIGVHNGTASATGSALVPGGGGSVSVPIAGGPALDANVLVDLLIDGP